MSDQYTQLAPNIQQAKRCTKCGVVKPLDEFYRNKNYRDGRGYRCKRCDYPTNADAREQRYADRAAGKKRCAKCGETKSVKEFTARKNRPDGCAPHCRACDRVRTEEWRKAHLPQVAAAMRHSAPPTRISFANTPRDTTGRTRKICSRVTGSE